MAQRITIQEYADIKGLMVYDIVQNAKKKGVILPEDPEYVLDDSQLRQIDPIFAHQYKYKQRFFSNFGTFMYLSLRRPLSAKEKSMLFHP